jgi:hypothetical protein
MKSTQRNEIIKKVCEIDPNLRENIVIFFQKAPGQYNKHQWIKETGDQPFVNRYAKLRTIFNKHKEWGCSVSASGHGAQLTIHFNY